MGANLRSLDYEPGVLPQLRCSLVWKTQWHSYCSLLGFSGSFCSYRKPNFPAVSGSYLPGFSCRICSYWKPIFSGRICSYLPGFSGLTFSDTRRPGFSGRICCFWPGFSGCSFSGMGNLKKTLWAAGKLFWYLQRDFLSLTREFSGGKLKQKGFFHSVRTTCQALSEHQSIAWNLPQKRFRWSSVEKRSEKEII